MNKLTQRLLRTASIIIFMAAFANVSCTFQNNANITGVVRADGKPLPGVRVSDGENVVVTDSKGRYRMESDKHQGTVFVVTPSGYVPAGNNGLQPRFWAELSATADKREKHDFELRSENQDGYSILFLTDLHLTNSNEKHDLHHFERLAMPLVKQLNEQYSQAGPVYAFNLGDLSHELYWYQFDFDVASAHDFLIGQNFPAPLYSIPGNHDHDGAITGPDVDFDSGWLYRKTFGPEYYSIDIGGSHWIMMDNVLYKNSPKSGKLNTGIAGARDYDIGFTDRQLEWLRNDLEFVGNDTPVYLCTHSPLLFYNRKNGIMPDSIQMDVLADLFDRFGNVTIFSGHAHRMLNLKNDKYPVFEQYVLSATSGNMWTTSNGFQTLGVDGANAGIFMGSFTGGDARYEYYTEEFGVKKLRAYDMNTVRDYYRTNPDVRTQMGLYSTRMDYAGPEFRNNILVNYWGYKHDEQVEMYENGRSLSVARVDFEDPLYNISYFVPLVAKSPVYKAALAKSDNPHMFAAKAVTSTAPIEIRITDKSGNVVYSETMTRPKAFDKDMP